MQDIDTDILYVNAGMTGAEIHLPFGGTKGTSNGHRGAGTAATDFYPKRQIFMSTDTTSCRAPRSPRLQTFRAARSSVRALSGW